MFCAAAGLMLALVPQVIWIVCRVVGKIFGHPVSFGPFGWTGLGLAVLFWAVMAYGHYIGQWKIETTEIRYHNSSLPEAFDGFRIVHISDMHLSTFDSAPEELERIVETVNALEPDLICFTGDLVTVGREEAEPYTETLRKMKAGSGVVSVLGNHDFLIYNHMLTDEDAREKAVEELAAYQTDALGWHLLRNSHHRICKDDGSHITIAGVDNANCSDQGFRTIDRGDLTKAMEGAEGFTILLTHDPTHWRHEVLSEARVPLTLSGHTHKAQVELFGWTPASWMFSESGGMYREGDMSLYVNSGLGCTLPFRIGVGPEITLIVLKR